MNPASQPVPHLEVVSHPAANQEVQPVLALPRLGPQQLDDLQEPGGCRRREELACSWLVEDTWVPQHRLESTPGMVTSLTGPVWSAGRPRLWEESRSGEPSSSTDTVTGREERITWVGEGNDLGRMSLST